jgi:hypothetical protein
MGKSGQGKNCIVAKMFIDTNILVYTLDKNDINKHTKARAVLKNIQDNDTPVISTQVLQEFYNASTAKLNTEKLLANRILSQGHLMIATCSLSKPEDRERLTLLNRLNLVMIGSNESSGKVGGNGKPDTVGKGDSSIRPFKTGSGLVHRLGDSVDYGKRRVVKGLHHSLSPFNPYIPDKPIKNLKKVDNTHKEDILARECLLKEGINNIGADLTLENGEQGASIQNIGHVSDL